MENLVDGWPVWAVFGFFFLVAMLRSHATYWAGRGLRAGGARSRLGERLDRPAVVRTESVVRRWGAPAVAVGFLTVGVQTLVNASAGALRMPLHRFVPATVVGSLLWATLYTSVGALLWRGLTGGGWWWLLVAAALVAAIVALSWWVSRLLAARSRGTA